MINAGQIPQQPVQKRRRRSVEVLSRSARSAELGVNSGYEVVSEVDLDFIPDAEEERERRKRIDTFQVFEFQMHQH